MAQKYLVHTELTDVVVEYEQDEQGEALVRLGEEGPWRKASLAEVGESRLFVLLLDNQPTEIYLERRRGGAAVTIGRHTFDYRVDRWRAAFDNRDREDTGPTGTVQILAPMTGSIVDVQRKTGDTVEAGDVVLIIESMKMDNELRAPGAGTVTAINVKAGDRVSAGQVLAVIEA